MMFYVSTNINFNYSTSKTSPAFLKQKLTERAEPAL